MTKEEYHQAVQNYDQDQLQAYIDTIPWNVNRAGLHFKKLIKLFKETQHDKRLRPTNRHKEPHQSP